MTGLLTVLGLLALEPDGVAEAVAFLGLFGAGVDLEDEGLELLEVLALLELVLLDLDSLLRG